jgi:uncharacterized protein Smg (DUF494 family)
MYERIIEIIVFVISELQHDKDINNLDITELKSRGYTSSEISAAISWLIDQLEFTDQFVSSGLLNPKTSFRVMHEAERDLFSKDALGEIIQFNSLGILNNEHIEMLIEKATMLGLPELDTSQVRSYIAYNVFNAQYNNIGSRFLLQGNDTIN